MISIKIENLSKQYRLGLVSTRTLSHDLNRFWRINIRGQEDPYLKIGEEMRRRESEGKGSFGSSSLSVENGSEYIWALRDINMEIRQGEVLGIIGKNGAGKSTLLKILSKVTAPTTGTIKARGRIASLLEVGTGFHSEMTGRENVFMNGAIMGMSKAEITRKLDEIIDFAGVEQFIDTPVKRYSSGMTVRLGFAVAAYLEPEILVIDEVLAVGDAEFQKKAIGKMQDISKGQGRTVLFVSHNMGAISQLCNNVLLLDRTIKFIDKPTRTINEYLHICNDRRKNGHLLFHGTLNSIIRFYDITINNLTSNERSIFISPNTDITINVKGNCKNDIPAFRLTFSVFLNGNRILTQHDTQKPETLKAGFFQSEIIIPKRILRPGEYSIAIGGYRDGMTDWIWCTDVEFFTITEEWDEQNEIINIGVINIPYKGKRTYN